VEDIHYILLQIALVLVAARVCAEIFSRFGAPTIIGELFAGILLGPSLLNWVTPNEVLKLLAEIGIILLLFEVGLETDLGRLIKSGFRSTVVAIAGFVLPFIFGFTTSYYLFELDILVSLFIGGTLTATSIGITVRVLAELGRHQSHEGQVVLGAAVIDDLLGVFLLAVLYEFAVSGTVSVANTGRIMLYVTAFFVLAPVLARIISPMIKHFHYRSSTPGLVPTALVSMVLFFATAAYMVGAPYLIGGFVAGIALSRRFFLPFGIALQADPKFVAYTHQQMKPIIQLFTPIFFVMVGLSLDLNAVNWGSTFIWTFSLVMVVVAVIGKLIGPWLIRETNVLRIIIGMSMVPRGEVGLIFAELGRSAGVLDAEVYAGMILVIAYTTLASPIWIKQYYKRVGDQLVKTDAL